MPRRIRDYGVAILAVGALFLALTRIDDRVPGHVAQMVADAWQGRWTAPGGELGDVLIRAVGSSALDNVFLVALMAAAALLVLLMVRT